jgi:hypothetical protein
MILLRGIVLDAGYEQRAHNVKSKPSIPELQTQTQQYGIKQAYKKSRDIIHTPSNSNHNIAHVSKEPQISLVENLYVQFDLIGK